MMRDDSAMNFHAHNLPLLPEQEFTEDLVIEKTVIEPIIFEIDFKPPFFVATNNISKKLR